MNKIQTIETIQKVKKFHESQMDNLQDFLNGKHVEEPVCISKTQCEFGRWLYGRENNIEKILGSHFYESLDRLHTQWHKEYSKIYELVYDKKKKGFFSKVFGSREGGLDPLSLDKAKLYYEELKVLSHELLKVLSLCQRRVFAMSDSMFDE